MNPSPPVQDFYRMFAHHRSVEGKVVTVYENETVQGLMYGSIADIKNLIEHGVDINRASRHEECDVQFLVSTMYLPILEARFYESMQFPLMMLARNCCLSDAEII